ncbi:ABC transporter ATP-binding protein [Polynucleobacter paneuropaeus]|nr:ABC transporter ATP-binding protein [Polynucleobacter paneuropaeus]
MSEIAIKVEGVSKVFRIYDYPTDRIKEAFSLSRKKIHSDYVALKNISFEVKKGEFLGIVGRNGAGKSTLLKILSRELTPTTGQVSINGVVSLLQLGVGFNSELTGIDNARFASRILGYSDTEIEEMLEDIISFADIGEFIYHPVKTYSSGMYSRLSFAIGININPDILIADEVLSVGDMRFSQKCLRKMREFKDSGKTVIFVSHDIQSVNIFCDSALWIKDGEIFLQGGARYVTSSFQNFMLYDKLPNEYDSLLGKDKMDEVIDSPKVAPSEFMSSSIGDDLVDRFNLENIKSVGDGRSEIFGMAFILADGNNSIASLQGGEEVILLLDIRVLAEMKNPQIGFVVYNQQGLVALHSNNDICQSPIPQLKSGEVICAKFQFKVPPLANGSYIFSVGIQTDLDMAHKIDDIYQFEVNRTDNKSLQCGYVIIENENFNIIKK